MSDLAAPHTLDEDVESIQKVLPPQAVFAWVRRIKVWMTTVTLTTNLPQMLYRERWLTILHDIHYPYSADGPDDTHPDACEDWERHRQSLLEDIGLALRSLVMLKSRFEVAISHRTECQYCRSMMRQWYTNVKTLVNSLPKFSSFL
jgi:hypothetical protein